MDALVVYQKSNINTSQIDLEINQSGFVSSFSGVSYNNGFLSVFGDSILDEEGLDDLVNNHSPNHIVITLKKTVKENKEFSDQLMQALKEKNLIEGLSSIDQAAWVHHKLRKVDYTLSDEETVVQIDVLNLVISGDIETADQVLSQIVPDDMSEPYHWLSQERINWIRNQIRGFLEWPLI